MAKVLGMGNALVDILIRLESDDLLYELNLPKGSMQLVDRIFARELEDRAAGTGIKKASGGSAANTIHGLAELGIETGYIGKVGHDDLGDFFKQDLERAGIRPMLFRGQADTGRAVTLISPDSERTFAVYLGAALEQTAEDISSELFRGYEYFYIEGYLLQNHELIETAIRVARENGLKVCLDLASYNVVEENLGFLKKLIPSYVDIIFANEEEALAFTGKEPGQALALLSEMTEIAIVKTGDKGSLIRKGKEEFEIGIIKADCIDTTGAGDLYAAGFLYGLINKLSMQRSGETGALLAGNVIEEIGAKISSRKWGEIRNSLL
jgi:sugar/nucleoside kinase (ribokinase family)